MVLKVWNFEIGFQDLEKVLNLAEMYKYENYEFSRLFFQILFFYSW